MNVDIFGEFGSGAHELKEGRRVRVKRTGEVALICDLWEHHLQLKFVSGDYSSYGIYRYDEIAALTPLEQLAEQAE